MERHQFGVVVDLALGRHGLPRRLAELELQRTAVTQPAAVLELLLEIGQRRQRIGTPAKLGEAVRLPIESRVGPVRLQIDQPAEPIESPFVFAFLDGLPTLVIEIVAAVVRVELPGRAQVHRAQGDRRHSRTVARAPRADRTMSEGLPGCRRREHCGNQH